jgi:hypothetical protein
MTLSFDEREPLDTPSLVVVFGVKANPDIVNPILGVLKGEKTTISGPNGVQIVKVATATNVTGDLDNIFNVQELKQLAEPGRFEGCPLRLVEKDPSLSHAAYKTADGGVHVIAPNILIIGEP